MKQLTFTINLFIDEDGQLTKAHTEPMPGITYTDKLALLDALGLAMEVLSSEVTQ
jgi:hypothetical protein